MAESLAWTGKHYKSASAKRHNIDRAEDKHMNRVEFGWMGSYNQRGLCVRIVCPPGIKHKIDRAKFITREDKSYSGPGFSWEKSFGYCTFDEFYDHIESQLEGFEWPELPAKYWDGINEYIERLNYKYERIDDIDQWTHTNLTELEMEKELSKLSSAQRSYIAALDVALKVDFQNGEAKDWMIELVSKLLQSDELSDWTIKYAAPSHYSRTNGYLEAIYGDLGNEETVLDFNSPFVSPSIHSCTSDFSSLSISSTSGHTEEKIKCGAVVPDFFVALPEFPGVFPLVVEMKPSSQENEGEFQNIKQMLTKMFYQDVIFGLVISPKGYRMSLIIKKNGSLYYTTTYPQYFINRTSKLGGKLEIKNLNRMCSFIYGILKWSRKTKCAFSDSE